MCDDSNAAKTSLKFGDDNGDNDSKEDNGHSNYSCYKHIMSPEWTEAQQGHQFNQWIIDISRFELETATPFKENIKIATAINNLQGAVNDLENKNKGKRRKGKNNNQQHYQQYNYNGQMQKGFNNSSSKGKNNNNDNKRKGKTGKGKNNFYNNDIYCYFCGK